MTFSVTIERHTVNDDDNVLVEYEHVERIVNVPFLGTINLWFADGETEKEPGTVINITDESSDDDTN